MRSASSSKTTLLQTNSVTQTRRRFLITPSKRPVLDDLSKQMFSQTWSHSWAVIKIWKASTATIQHLWSDSEKCRLSRIVSRRYIRSVRRIPSQYLHYNTAKCLHSPTNPASGNFCRSTYWQVRRLHIQHQRCGENWSLSDRGTSRHYLDCSCTFLLLLYCLAI